MTAATTLMMIISKWQRPKNLSQRPSMDSDLWTNNFHLTPLFVLQTVHRALRAALHISYCTKNRVQRRNSYRSSASFLGKL